MNNEKNSHSYKQNEDVNLSMDSIHARDNTELILTRKKTRYTDGANKIIEKVQNEFLERKRVEEIDLALENKDKKRFLELTSDNWKDVL